MVRRDADHGITGGGAVRVQSKTYQPFQPVRRIGFRAEIAIVDADAKSNASASASGTSLPSDPAQTVDGITRNPQTFATLERNAWILDGNHAMMDSSAANLGWWSSAVSNADGNFSDEVYIDYTFSQDAKTVGVIFLFAAGNQPAAGGMRIRTYDAGGNLLADVYNTQSTPTQEIQFISTYRRMRVDFTKTVLPGRRIRMLELDFGVTQRFDADTISSAEIRYQTDLSSMSIPFGQLSIVVDNSDKRWNLLNPDGIYQYLEAGQKVSAWANVDGEDVYMGAWSFYAAEAKDNALTAKITAVDPIALLDDGIYNGGRYVVVPLSEAIAEVLADTGIACVYDGDIGGTQVALSVPQKTTKREAVRLLVQAAMCCVYADRGGNLHFARPNANAAVSGELTANELYNFDGITISQTYEALELIVKDDYTGTEIVYTAGTGTKIYTVKNPCIAPENGDACAAWLLSHLSRRKDYDVKNRCDPAAEIADTIKIQDAYGNNGTAVVSGIVISYDGGISSILEASG